MRPVAYPSGDAYGVGDFAPELVCGERPSDYGRGEAGSGHLEHLVARFFDPGDSADGRDDLVELLRLVEVDELECLVKRLALQAGRGSRRRQR